MPSGAKMTARTKRNGITELGVKMGCHALSLCCLNAVLGGFLDL